MKDQKDQGETHLIHSFPKSEAEKIQIAIRKYKGKHYIDLRVWFQTEENATFFPSKRGISLSLDLLPELRKGMERLLKAADKFRQPEELAV